MDGWDQRKASRQRCWNGTMYYDAWRVSCSLWHCDITQFRKRWFNNRRCLVFGFEGTYLAGSVHMTSILIKLYVPWSSQRAHPLRSWHFRWYCCGWHWWSVLPFEMITWYNRHMWHIYILVSITMYYFDYFDCISMHFLVQPLHPWLELWVVTGLSSARSGAAHQLTGFGGGNAWPGGAMRIWHHTPWEHLWKYYRSVQPYMEIIWRSCIWFVMILYQSLVPMPWATKYHSEFPGHRMTGVTDLWSIVKHCEASVVKCFNASFSACVWESRPLN